MRRCVAIVLALTTLSACQTVDTESATQSTPAVAAHAASVEVRPDGDAFRARMTFPDDARVWAFHRSAVRREDRKPWRPDSWTVLTPGVELVRIGEYDALVASDGGAVPRNVEIAFAPAAVDLVADYDPALVFTDGTVALFSGVFSVFPAESQTALEASDANFESPATEVAMVNPGSSVFHQGRYVERAQFEEDGYGIYGDVTVDPATPVARIFDPALPAWLGDSLDQTTPRVFAFYEKELGDHGGAKPLVIASYAESEMQGVSQGGSVLPGLITMSFEGAGLDSPNEAVLVNTTWFIAHEAAHFWLGQALSYDSRDRAWITEGGADLMAMRVAEAFNPSFPAEQFVDDARKECAAALRESGIEAARLRNEQRPYYACGSLFALAVEQAGASRGEDYFDFVRQLIADQDDGKVDGEEWLQAAASFGVSPDRVALMRRLLAGPSDDPESDLERLLNG